VTDPIVIVGAGAAGLVAAAFAVSSTGRPVVLLESRRRRGLFLCDEMLDAFGPIGGHNFAWAWATGRLAGLGARG
jgi:predicted flavoprotein YhiN